MLVSCERDKPAEKERRLGFRYGRGSIRNLERWAIETPTRIYGSIEVYIRPGSFSGDHDRSPP